MGERLDNHLVLHSFRKMAYCIVLSKMGAPASSVLNETNSLNSPFPSHSQSLTQALRGDVVLLYVGVETPSLLDREQILEQGSRGLGSKPCSSEARVEIPPDRVGVILWYGEQVTDELVGVSQAYGDVFIAIASRFGLRFRRAHILQLERQETTRCRLMQISK